ncbi:CBS domain-containing protein [Tepidibacillus marianensis]|uniref:CBS domain-containing protein n=1 Tax=Tepidibacillus marianensis TaxID=3131995 RepID=UPI0030CBC61C
MFIRNCITSMENLVIIKETDSIGYTLRVLKENELKSAPVLNSEGKFIGIISKETLFEKVEKNPNMSFVIYKENRVTDVVVPIQTLQIDSRFEETLPLIIRYPFVPIVDEKQMFIGIVKRKSITQTLEAAFGVGVLGLRLLIGTPELEGRLERILDIAHQLHLNVITAMAFDAGETLTRRILLKVEPTDQKNELIRRLERNGFKVLTIHEN